MTEPTPHPTWLPALRRYLGAIALLDIVWETLQLPLYTIWTLGSLRDQVVAVLHCTAGDVLIALSTLIGALIVAGGSEWPRQGRIRVSLLTVVAGVAYTVFSEWLNTEVRQSWAYSALMPVIPPFGTGLSPLLQWVIVPSIALAWAPRGVSLPSARSASDETE